MACFGLGSLIVNVGLRLNFAVPAKWIIIKQIADGINNHDLLQGHDKKHKKSGAYRPWHPENDVIIYTKKVNNFE